MDNRPFNDRHPFKNEKAYFMPRKRGSALDKGQTTQCAIKSYRKSRKRGQPLK
jgi:hypothetical protein